MTRQKLLTTQEVAEILGVTRWRVNALIRDKRLKAEKFGRIWLVTPKAVESVKDRPTGRPKKKES